MIQYTTWPQFTCLNQSDVKIKARPSQSINLTYIHSAQIFIRGSLKITQIFKDKKIVNIIYRKVIIQGYNLEYLPLHDAYYLFFFIPTFYYENFQTYRKVEDNDHPYTHHLDSTLVNGLMVLPYFLFLSNFSSWII